MLIEYKKKIDTNLMQVTARNFRVNGFYNRIYCVFK